ncbi:hypothetical protein [Streptomyces sp. NPDC014995]
MPRRRVPSDRNATTGTRVIEEYARRNGHPDLARERVDGVTGG